ncbi:MAG: hypothetical protein HUU08_14790 [Candidatus Brocadia sp.]|nr:hypothetical protein [Candidatus Brocadia sp.]
MRFMGWYLGVVCIAVLGTSALSDAFDIQLTQEQIKEANEYGAKYKGKDIFESPVVKLACFGEYPKGEGGLIMSKYIKIAVSSAMKAIKDQTLTPADLKEIEKSATFNVVVSVPEEGIQSPEDVQIILKQGTNVILPTKNEFGMKYKDKRQGIVGAFRYDKINPHASTAIVVKTKKSEEKYKIDFSDVK